MKKSQPIGFDIDGHVNLIGNFIETLRGDAALWGDGREGRHSLSAVLGVYEAAGLGK